MLKKILMVMLFIGAITSTVSATYLKSGYGYLKVGSTNTIEYVSQKGMASNFTIQGLVIKFVADYLSCKSDGTLELRDNKFEWSRIAGPGNVFQYGHGSIRLNPER